MSEKRRDNKGRILREGECQEKDGSYTYRYTDKKQKRHKLSSWRLTVHIAKLNGRVCGAKRPHSVSKRSVNAMFE